MKPTLGDTQARPDYLIAGGSLVFGLFCLGGWYSTHQKLKSTQREVVAQKVKANRSMSLRKTYQEFFTLARSPIPNTDRGQELYDELARRGSLKGNLDIWEKDSPGLRQQIISSLAQGTIKPFGNEWKKDLELQDIYQRAVISGVIKEDAELRKMTAPLLKAGLITPVSSKGGSSGK